MAVIKHITVAPNLAFMARRKLFLAFSAALVLASVALFLVQGLNFGVDFRGGILMEVKTDGPANLGEMRSLLGGLGLGEVTLQEFGEPDDVLINLQRQDGEEAPAGTASCRCRRRARRCRCRPAPARASPCAR